MKRLILLGLLWLSVVFPAHAAKIGGSGSGLPAVGSEGDCLLISGGVPSWGACPGTGTGAPTGAKYIVQTADVTLTAEQALSTLATGIMKVTTATGVISVAVAGTDYVIPSGNVATATALSADPADCPANNFATAINASGTLTCGQPSISAGVSGLGTNVSGFLATPTSANLAAALTNETGSGAAVFGTAPTIDSPIMTTKYNPPSVTAFPGTPSTGDVVIVTDDSSIGACDSAAGTAVTQCRYSGSAWVKLGDGGAGGGIGGTVGATDLAVPKASGTGGSTLQASGCTISAGNIMTCPGGFSAGGAGVGVMTLLEGTAPGAGTNAGEHNVYFDSADSKLKSQKNGGSVVTYARNAAEGTGLTIPRRLWFPAAGCNNATAGSVWDLPTTSPAVPACITGTNTQKGVLDFADAANLSAQITYVLPTTWTGSIDAKVKWLTTATSGDVVWQISTSCVADAETDDPTFNTADAFAADTAKGTTNQTNDATKTGLTTTGCAAGELLHLKIFRDSAHASDTMAATARLIGVELVIRESL